MGRNRGISLASDERYRKQMLFSEIGRAGQRRLGESSVLIVGCGALGCVLADAMVRAGTGCVRIVDRDFVELSNLQRQILFTEDDCRQNLPKAVAAGNRLRRVNSEITVETIVADVDYTNVLGFASGMNLMLDGTDNFEIRYLINDVSLETGIPWIFTGCTGSQGQLMPVFPGRSACLRCLMQTPPPPGSTETCDSAGVLGPAIGVAASLQAAMALRILSQPAESAESRVSSEEVPSNFGVPLKLTMIDVWDATFRQLDVSKLRDQTDCPACRQGERLWLRGTRKSGSTILCGRNAVQVSPPEAIQLSLTELSERLSVAGVVTVNPFLVRVTLPPGGDGAPTMEMTVFPDGRAIIRGTEDPSVARSLYSRYIGS